MALIGIDVGTSGTKTLVIDEGGKLLASATVAYEPSSPKPLWSEDDPRKWWDAAVESIRTVMDRSGLKADDVKGVGLSGQMHGLCLLDGANEILRPAILWNDQRTAEECAEIEERAGGREALIKLVSNPALTGFTAPKILWVRKNEPEVYEKARRILLPKDYVRYKLTSEYATEVSDASGMLLLNVAKRAWSDELLSKLEIDKALLPKLYESPEVTGKLTKEAAGATGLRAGTPVVGGGGDQAAGAVGNGIVRRGVVSATVGTSGVVFAHADEVETDPRGRVHTFCHAVPGKWHVMGVVLSAGGSFQWMRNNLAFAEAALARSTGRDPYEFMTEVAASAPPGSEGLLFLPYLTGERTPHADPFARACFIGVTARHTWAHMLRSVMEGAAFAMRDSFEIIRGMGVPIDEVRLSGGGARSGLWREIQADVYGTDAVVVSSTEGPAFGVALLAGVGTGVWKSVEEACDATIKVVDRTACDEERKAVYDRAYEVYVSLYRALKDDFRRIAELVASG